MAKKKVEDSGDTLIEDVDSKPKKKKSIFDHIITGQALINRPRVIIPVSPSIDVMLGGGVPEGSFVIPTGPPKVGKMQPVSCGVYTPTGFVKIKNLSVNDCVCNPNGGVSVIENIVYHGKKDVYKVCFSDKTHTYCGLEHLWKVRSRFRKNWEVIDVEYLLASKLYEGDGRPRWAIPLTTPVYFDNQEIMITPYVLGVLLGDGGITSGVKLSSVDQELVDRVNGELQDGFYFQKLSGDNCDWFLKTSRQPNIYKQELKKLRLMGKNSHTKFIPKKYLYNSIVNRQALLQGLLDTDGHITKKGIVEFYTTSIKLARGVKFLVQSLGGFCVIKPKTTTCNGKSFDSYRLHIRMTNKEDLFSLSRKKDRVVKRTKKPLCRYITKIIKLKKQQTSACIKVDDTEGLYLTNDFIVTHNTTFSLQLAANAQLDRYKSELTPNGREVFFYNIEGRLKKRDLLGIRGLDPNRFQIIQSEPGRILDGEDYIEIAEQLINERPGAVHILDSFSQLCTTARREGDVRDRFRDDTPLLLATFCKRICNVIPVNRSIVIGITHMIANQGGGPMAPKRMEASGNKVQYAVDVKLVGKYKKDWKVGDTLVGQEIYWECDSSALGPPTEGMSLLRYGYGFDKEAELITLAGEFALIEKGGSWYTFSDGSKVQGLENARNKLVENPAMYDEIYGKLRQLLNLDMVT